MSKKTWSYLLLALAILIGLIWLIYAKVPKWTSTRCYEDISPKGSYKIVHCAWDYGSDYGYFRVYDNRTGQLLAESDFRIILTTGRILWPEKNRKYILVDMDFTVPAEPEPE